jgi:GNAT superfamily N-acetyltransferase
MDRFYGGTKFEPLETRVRQINEALFDVHPAAYALLAWSGAIPVGFASYSFLWPAVGLTRSLFLKELFVVEAARRSGVGRELMNALFGIALEQGCSRVEWQTETGNMGARQFYTSFVGREFEGKVFFRIEGDELKGALK